MSINNSMSVDDIVQARCPNCDHVQNHTLIEIVNEGAARIRCNTCQSVGVFKGKKTGRATAAKKTGKGASASRKSLETLAAKEREQWVSLRPGMQPEKAILYRMTGTYHVRDLVEHESFGLGLVTREVGPHKIEVLFEQGKKLLCCR